VEALHRAGRGADENAFEDGIGFDGSSLRGWVAINESDMLLMPQPDTLFIDPFCKTSPWRCCATSRTR
jgi:glutamine synthetase